MNLYSTAPMDMEDMGEVITDEDIIDLHLL